METVLGVGRGIRAYPTDWSSAAVPAGAASQCRLARSCRAGLRGTAVPASLQALGAVCHVTGDTVRAILSEANQDAAIDALRRERLRLVSVTPVRTSLEDYYLQKLQPVVAMSGAKA